MDVPVPFGRILLAPPSPQGAAARPENPSPPGNAPEAARPSRTGRELRQAAGPLHRLPRPRERRSPSGKNKKRVCGA